MADEIPEFLGEDGARIDLLEANLGGAGVNFGPPDTGRFGLINIAFMFTTELIMVYSADPSLTGA